MQKDVSPWDPGLVSVSLLATISTKPGNSSDKDAAALDWWVVPTFNRPDGQTVGGVTTVRLIVDKVTLVNGDTQSTVGGTLTVFCANTSNSNGTIASKVIVAGDVDADGETTVLTLGTGTSTRNSVTVPDRCLLAGDKITFTATGTHASDLIKLGARLLVEAHWESQAQQEV